ncbi:type II toxin-antitoxin system RnlA family toxin [Salinicoccus sp. ID82-1]|uniref:ribonuclease H1 domain-containing protein n=1 Tax=Salinicoccus sp. ID82-1 TaxID=2820269 RepID=UPI001F2C51A8|nr:type II toxin-antitoxin system RnlA family toxin [Salinicoccus sp. ID82-1]
MAKNFYAVKKGHKTGIFDNWSEAQEATKGYPKAKYKGFDTLEEADTYMSSEEEPTQVGLKTSAAEINDSVEDKIKALSGGEAVIFVDGSFSSNEKRYGYGSIIIIKDHEESLYKSGAEEDLLPSQNVAGEILGVIDSIEYCIDNNITNVSLYYDYEGIEKWATEKWRAKSDIAKRYTTFIKANKSKIAINFFKVPAHQGVEYNEKADKLAKYSLLKEGYRTHKDGSVRINKKTEDEFNKIVNDLNLEYEGNINIRVAEDDKSYRKIIKLSYDGQKVTVTLYNKNNTLYIQGNDSELFNKLLTLILERTEKEETREVLNRYYGAEMSEEAVLLEFNRRLPDYDYEENDLPHYNNLQSAIYNLMLTGYRPDYSFLVYPVFRSFEFIFHRVLNESMEVETEDEKGRNTFSKNFQEDENGYFRCMNKKRKKLSQVQLVYLEDLFNYYSNNRHSYSHWSKDSLDTQMISDINNAKSIIKVGLSKINGYYKNF